MLNSNLMHYAKIFITFSNYIISNCTLPKSLTTYAWGAIHAKYTFDNKALQLDKHHMFLCWSLLVWSITLYATVRWTLWMLSFDEDKTSLWVSFPFGRSKNPCCYHKAGSHGCWHWCYGCAHGKSDSSKTWHHWSSEQVCWGTFTLFLRINLFSHEYEFKSKVTWHGNKQQVCWLLAYFSKICSSCQPTADLK